MLDGLDGLDKFIWMKTETFSRNWGFIKKMMESAMPKTAVITDTDASLPLELASRYKIVQVPIIVQFGEESLRAVHDLDDTQVFARIDWERKLPTTSAPSPGQFEQAFREAFESGYEAILCFTVSGEVSATYNSARNAAAMFPDREITVVDTRSLAIGQGFQVLAAARALENGMGKVEALSAAKSVGERTHLFAALATLKYLAMSGRVGHLTAGIANLLDVKPILTIRNGKLDLLERVRTRQKAWARVLELAVEAAGGQRIEQMSILHVDAAEQAKRFEEQLRAKLQCPPEILFTELTPGLSVHSGAGLVGACFVTAE